MQSVHHRPGQGHSTLHQPRLIPATLSPKEVALLVLESGNYKHSQSLDVLFFKSVIAGVFLSFGGLLDVVLSGGATTLNEENPGLVKILGGFVFPVGLCMIVLTGAELLTSDMMVFQMVLLKRRLPWWSLPYNWFVVFFGNLAGSLFFAAILVKYSGVISSEPYRGWIQKFVVTKVVTPAWHEIFLRGIACNWLVCIAVWMAVGANETVSKIFAIWLPIWTFVACGFDHVVANMFSVPAGIMLGGDLTAATYIWKSMIPAFIGNAIGASFVAFPAWWFFLRDVPNGREGTHVMDEENGGGSVLQDNSDVADKATKVS